MRYDSSSSTSDLLGDQDLFGPNQSSDQVNNPFANSSISNSLSGSTLQGFGNRDAQGGLRIDSDQFSGAHGFLPPDNSTSLNSFNYPASSTLSIDHLSRNLHNLSIGRAIAERVNPNYSANFPEFTSPGSNSQDGVFTSGMLTSSGSYLHPTELPYSERNSQYDLASSSRSYLHPTELPYSGSYSQYGTFTSPRSYLHSTELPFPGSNSQYGRFISPGSYLQTPELPRPGSYLRSSLGQSLGSNFPEREVFPNNRSDSENSTSNFLSLSSPLTQPNVVSIAKDYFGCHDLQSKLESGDEHDYRTIVRAVTFHMVELMVHKNANKLVQKVIDVANRVQLQQILASIMSTDFQRFILICDNIYGSFVVQKLICKLRNYPQKRSSFVLFLQHVVVILSKRSTASRVVKQCLNWFPFEVNKPLINKIAAHCFELAQEQSGCFIVKDCLSYFFFDEAAFDHMVLEVIANAGYLSTHPFGNYVVQTLIDLQKPGITRQIIVQLRGEFSSISMDKYGSNVVEKILKSGYRYGHQNNANVGEIIDELITSPDFEDVCRHEFGNYVVQTAFKRSKFVMRVHHEALIHRIRTLHSSTESHIYGKRVKDLLK